MAQRRRLFVFVYALSGAAALVYEVSWTRLLALHMGHTVAAASTVLAAFMGGLAIGATVAGPLSTRATPGRRLRLYAACEIAVAVAALLLPFALAAMRPALAWAYADGTAPLRFALVRALLSLGLLAIPAAAMGATYPFAAGWLGAADRDRQSAAADAGVAYASNTAGAAAGAIAAGFWLLPAIGLRATTWIGVLLNIVAAAVAWRLSLVPVETVESGGSGTPRDARVKTNAARDRRSVRAPQPRLAAPPKPLLGCLAAAVSGFVALVYEVAWTRMLALVMGPTTYAFAAMAASFVGGLAVGSAAGTRIARRTSQPARWLGLALIVTAAAASAAAWFAATRLPLIVAADVADPSAAFAPIVIKQALTAALVLAPMTMALGAAFPLALAVVSSGQTAIGSDAARVYASNTAGAIAGALAAGFLLIPAIGLKATFVSMAIAGAVAGLVVAPTLPAAASAVVVVAIVAGGAPRWDRDLLASGAYKYAPYMASGDLGAALHAGRLLYYRDGAAATVTVRRMAGTLSLAIDGKVDASNGGDMLTQRMLGLVPTLLHRNPREICIIGLGSGVTLAAALSSGTVMHADVVEISSEVVEASRFFDRENRDALHAPGVRLIVGDGRSHLTLTPRTYDVIVSEPSNPWIAGVAALFTREFFEAARRRLAPGGVICQWAHTYDMSPADLASIVHTFALVFPQGSIWLVGDGDLLLVGGATETIDSHLQELPRTSARGGVREMMADSGVATDVPFAVASLFAGGPREVAAYGDDAPVQTDDRMALEYSAPRGIYGRGGADNAAVFRAMAGTSEKPPALRAILARGDARAWSARASMALKAEAYATAYAGYRRAVELDAREPAALSGFSDAAAGARRQDEERTWLEQLAASQPANAAVRIELSRLYASKGDFDRAVARAEEASRISPDDPRGPEQLASVLADAGDADRLMSVARALVARFPDRPDARYYLATALFMTGRAPEAESAVRTVLAAHPSHARAQNLLGAACATVGQRDCARAAFLASLDSNPRDPATYVNLGQLAFDGGDPAEAIEYFAEALSLDPTNAAAHDGIARVRSAR